MYMSILIYLQEEAANNPVGLTSSGKYLFVARIGIPY